MHANNSTLQKSSQKPAVSEEFASLIAGSVFIFSINKQSNSCFTDHLFFFFFFGCHMHGWNALCASENLHEDSLFLSPWWFFGTRRNLFSLSLSTVAFSFFLSFVFFSLWVEAIVFIHFLEFEFISLLLGVCCDLGETHLFRCWI